MHRSWVLHFVTSDSGNQRVASDIVFKEVLGTLEVASMCVGFLYR